MQNVHTFDDWENVFKKAGVKSINIQKNSLEFNGMRGMISDEGFKNAVNVMFNYIGNSKVRNRMKKLNDFILSYPEYFGYGIYICKKK
jgi:hypothetical protein